MDPVKAMILAGLRAKADKAGVPPEVFDLVEGALGTAGVQVSMIVNATIEEKRASAVRDLAAAAKDLHDIGTDSPSDAATIFALRDQIIADIGDVYDTGDDDEAPAPS